MSTKQSAIAVVPRERSNQRSPLSLLHLPLVKGSPSGVPGESFEVVFLYAHLNNFKHSQVSFCSKS